MHIESIFDSVIPVENFGIAIPVFFGAIDIEIEAIPNFSFQIAPIAGNSHYPTVQQIARCRIAALGFRNIYNNIFSVRDIIVRFIVYLEVLFDK